MGGPKGESKVLPTQQRVYDHATVFLCVPLRTAVICIGLSSLLLGIALMFDRVGTEESLRPYIGGYARRSRTVIGLLDVLGIFVGPLGIAGAWNHHSGHIKLFLGYQVVRLAAWGWMYYVDIPQLWTCELWTTNVVAAEQKYSWNPIMFNIAIASRCQSERMWFFSCSVLTFLFAVSCVAATQRLLAEMEDEPPYLYKVPFGTTNGAFYTRSWASQSIHEQLKEQVEKEAKLAEVQSHLQHAQFAKHVGMTPEAVSRSGLGPQLGPEPVDPAMPAQPGWDLPHFGVGPPPAFAESAPAGFFKAAAGAGEAFGALRGQRPRPPWSSEPGLPASKMVHEVLGHPTTQMIHEMI